ncbi:MAG TPA: hypothetical protein VKB78_14615, partial [Pirellulales bacterium]|nr:hypothetical protein [Pirellulales bacterium]
CRDKENGVSQVAPGQTIPPTDPAEDAQLSPVHNLRHTRTRVLGMFAEKFAVVLPRIDGGPNSNHCAERPIARQRQIGFAWWIAT